MDVLIVEPIDSDVLQWLGARHATHYGPELALDARALREALAAARAVVIPPAVPLDAAALRAAARLRVVGRLSVGAENIDLEACARTGIEVVRPASAGAVAEAEFVVGALLQMLRRVPIISDEGLLVGRELGGSIVGVVGMTPALKPLATLLAAFGARTLGYDPGVHTSEAVWQRAGVEPVGLRELMQACDAVAVMLTYYPRYAGLFGERLLAEAKANQVIVNLAHSALFDEAALAAALTQGQLAAAWFDSLEPGAQDAGRPLRHLDNLQVTPRVASTTRESRLRSAWAVARRIDEVLAAEPAPAHEKFRTTFPGALADLGGGPAPA
jgi:phosphoglycerate dehydrogenase-like enzyme